MQKLIPIRAGFTNCFLLVENGNCLLVDTSTRDHAEKLIKAITSRGFALSDLKFIFLTHCHYDHAGSAKSIQEASGARVIVHESEKESLAEGFMRIPKGTSAIYKFISFMGRKGPMERKIGGYAPVNADMTFKDALDLSDDGFNARVIHTPGHTVGSSTLIVGDQAVVGDAMFNMTGNYYPGFANDEPVLLKTWQQLIQLDVKRYYPSHGKPIEKSKLLAFIKKRKLLQINPSRQ
jgi:glyoxylase-like metal-dependent hydrolase (beta-lactamase superfamily II)